MDLDRWLRRVPRGAWMRGWLRLAGPGTLGRMAARLAMLGAPPFPGRLRLAELSRKGFIAPSAEIAHPAFTAGNHLYIDDRVRIFETKPGGAIVFGERVRILRDSWLETGPDCRIEIGDRTFIQPRCQMSAHVGSIRIGRRVQIATNCSFFSYDHGIDPGMPIWDQPLTSRGDIEIGDDAWLGCGVVVLSGARIGAGAVVGAGSVVVRDIPDGAIAVGNPARVVRMRAALSPSDPETVSITS